VTATKYAIRPAREERALADVIVMVQELLDEARSLVAAGCHSWQWSIA
jgi:hypothetical protein